MVSLIFQIVRFLWVLYCFVKPLRRYLYNIIKVWWWWRRQWIFTSLKYLGLWLISVINLLKWVIKNLLWVINLVSPYLHWNNTFLTHLVFRFLTYNFLDMFCVWWLFDLLYHRFIQLLMRESKKLCLIPNNILW